MPDSLPGPRAGLQWAQCTAMVFDRAVKIEIWSDVVCPWCYIGKTNLEAALADSGNADDVEVVFRSFLLDPSAPVQPLSAVDHLAEKYGGGRAQALEMMRQVTAVAAGVGLEYHLEESLTGQTLDAHRLLHLAKEHDLQDATASRLFAGHFTEGRSLFDHDSLTSLAVEAGLPEQDVRTTLEAGTFAADVEADLP
ncbi:MAG TPA: DsbA family oxidoreductase [Actinomycetota bacterium]|nr:DsbA family oxidoreductase [Actinomycetota bacterium]